MTNTRWFILDADNQLIDGEMFDNYGQLLHAVGYHTKPGARVMGFNPAELVSPAAGLEFRTSLVDVTKAVAHAWWDADGCADTREAVAAGEDVCWLALQFFETEVGQFEADVNVDADRAEYYRDAMGGY